MPKIYKAGMMACNNDNMQNPYPYIGLRMLILLCRGSEREGIGMQFEEGVNGKVKLDIATQRTWNKPEFQSIWVGLVMQELDSCVSLGQEHMA